MLSTKRALVVPAKLAMTNTNNTTQNIYSSPVFFLNASECNAQRHISLPHLVQRLIETATNHAAVLRVGYEDLLKHRLSWVLSRLTLEISQFPSVNTYYGILTWVESINRHFTTRCFAILDGKTGSVMGYARTLWMAMDMDKRRGADMTEIMAHVECVDRPCPIEPQAKIPAVKFPDQARSHTFGYCDIDFNRHVNSTRYIEALLNQRDVAFYDTHELTRFEIAYLDEIHHGAPVEILREPQDHSDIYEISHAGHPYTRARITYRHA